MTAKRFEHQVNLLEDIAKRVINVPLDKFHCTINENLDDPHYQEKGGLDYTYFQKVLNLGSEVQRLREHLHFWVYLGERYTLDLEIKREYFTKDYPIEGYFGVKKPEILPDREHISVDVTEEKLKIIQFYTNTFWIPNKVTWNFDEHLHPELSPRIYEACYLIESSYNELRSNEGKKLRNQESRYFIQLRKRVEKSLTSSRKKANRSRK